jgi:pSer/pThr/pTyr-binding forkhead associated (FHA) protein
MGTFLINETQIIPMDFFPFTIGRQLSCNLVIQEPTVSRIHAQIVKSGNEFYLEDLGSSGGTYLNSLKVIYIKISTGDNILLSQIPLIFAHSKTDDLRIDEQTTGHFFKPSIDTNPTKLNISYFWRPPKEK